MFLDSKKFDSYFSDQLKFSNIRSRTSRQIYGLPLTLRTPETVSSLSQSIFNAHLVLFVQRMSSHNSICKYCHFVNYLSNLPWNGVSPLADPTHCRTGKEVDVRYST